MGNKGCEAFVPLQKRNKARRWQNSTQGLRGLQERFGQKMKLPILSEVSCREFVEGYGVGL